MTRKTELEHNSFYEIDSYGKLMIAQCQVSCDGGEYWFIRKNSDGKHKEVKAHLIFNKINKD